MISTGQFGASRDRSIWPLLIELCDEMMDCWEVRPGATSGMRRESRETPIGEELYDPSEVVIGINWLKWQARDDRKQLMCTKSDFDDDLRADAQVVHVKMLDWRAKWG